MESVKHAEVVVKKTVLRVRVQVKKITRFARRVKGLEH